MRIFTTLLLVALLSTTARAAEQNIVKTFQGRGDDYNLGFSVDGHWELRWQVEGNQDFPSFSQFEVRLEDALTGQFLGVAAQNTGSGQGVRYINEGGRYLVHVLAKNARWKLDVVDVEEPWAKVPDLQDTEEEYRMKVIVTDEAGDPKSAIPERQAAEKTPE